MQNIRYVLECQQTANIFAGYRAVSPIEDKSKLTWQDCIAKRRNVVSHHARSIYRPYVCRSAQTNVRVRCSRGSREMHFLARAQRNGAHPRSLAGRTSSCIRRRRARENTSKERQSRAKSSVGDFAILIIIYSRLQLRAVFNFPGFAANSNRPGRKEGAGGRNAAIGR